MARPPLNKEILKFMRNHPEYTWFKKVSLYSQFEDWSPETIGRTLRELEETGKLQVSYYDGKYAKGLAKYKLAEVVEPKQSVEIINGLAYIKYGN
jgi:hypothetical protein